MLRDEDRQLAVLVFLIAFLVGGNLAAAVSLLLHLHRAQTVACWLTGEGC